MGIHIRKRMSNILFVTYKQTKNTVKTNQRWGPHNAQSFANSYCPPTKEHLQKGEGSSSVVLPGEERSLKIFSCVQGEK